MKRCRIFILIPLFIVITLSCLEARPSLQTLIDQTPVGGVVPLEPGVYTGNAIIEKKITLDGRGVVILDGQNRGTVVTVKADEVVVKNLTIINSGESHDRVDAGIRILSSHGKYLNNIIQNCLFGIDLKQAHNNEVSGNDISSKKADLGVRGDGIRGWASHRNIFRKNKIHDSRDMVIWYSNDNLIEENEGWNNRYSLHFMFAGGNLVRKNNYHHNTVGIFLMYSRDATVEYNTIKYSLGGTGVGIGLKEADNMIVRNNTIIYCTKGFYFDLSPYQPDRYNFIKANKIAYNVTGISFNSELARNIFKGNALIDNLEPLEVHANGLASQSTWEGNYYSDYQGFDRNDDGYGDHPYNYDVFFETLWMDDAWLRFFYGTPILSVLNLIARLAPISEPRRLMVDSKPVFDLYADLLISEENLFFDPPVIYADEDDDDDDDEGDMPARFSSSDDDDEDNDDEPIEDDAESDEQPVSAEQDENYNRYYLKQ